MDELNGFHERRIKGISLARLGVRQGSQIKPERRVNAIEGFPYGGRASARPCDPFVDVGDVKRTGRKGANLCSV